MTTPQLIQLGLRTAVLSFAGATLLLLGYESSRADGFLFMGALFLLVALGLNLGVGGALLWRWATTTGPHLRIGLTLGLMLLNIPVAVGYSQLVDHWLNTIELTLINAGSVPLTDLRLSGCTTRRIPALAPADSVLLRFPIPADCSLDASYRAHGQRQQESVIGYASNNMGRRVRYRLARPSSAERPVD